MNAQPRHHKTNRRLEVLAAVRKDPRASVRELSEATGMSLSHVYYYLNQLEREGLIDRRRRQARGISLRKRADSAETRAKKAAAGRKTRILDQRGKLKGKAGIGAATWRRIEIIGKREDAKKAQHSSDVLNQYRGGHQAGGLSCTKLG